MTNNTFAIRKFITTCYNKCQDSYCWYNVPKLLSDEDINKMKAYFEERNYKFMLIINGCNELRPQRTWGSIPVFLKGTRDGNIMHQDINTFVFCSWINEYDEYKNDIEELINSIPKDMEHFIFTEKCCVYKIKMHLSSEPLIESPIFDWAYNLKLSKE